MQIEMAANYEIERHTNFEGEYLLLPNHSVFDLYCGTSKQVVTARRAWRTDLAGSAEMNHRCIQLQMNLIQTSLRVMQTVSVIIRLYQHRQVSRSIACSKFSAMSTFDSVFL